MTDFYLQVAISRDDIAAALTQQPEQTPYVMAAVMAEIRDGTIEFDDFCDGLEALNEKQQEAVLAFAEALCKSRGI